jgi:hypothetical protein
MNSPDFSSENESEISVSDEYESSNSGIDEDFDENEIIDYDRLYENSE